MSSLQRILSFVPPILLFVFPAFGQIQGKLVQLPGTSTYKVSVVSTFDIVPPSSSTGSAQITLRAKSGKLDLTNFQSLTGTWEIQSQYIAPVEAPDFDYFRFFLNNPITNISYLSGTEVSLFSFDNSDPCTLIELVDNNTDPFVSNNSLMINAENYFSLSGGNAYSGNTGEYAVACPTLSLVVSASENPVKCFGDKTNLSVKAVEGVQPYTVVYTHIGSGMTSNATINTFEGTTTFNNVPAGNYSFAISDSKDSVAQLDYQVSQPIQLSVDLAPGPATCVGSMDGNVVVDDVNGINGHDINAYQYYWDADPNSSNVIIDSLETGTYTVTVVDANGCSSISSTFVGYYNELFLQETVVAIRCFGENNGIIDIEPIGIAPPYEFYWSPNANTGNESAAYLLGAGEYQVTVTAAGGACSHTESFFVYEPEEIEVDYRMIEPECYGDEALLNVLAVENAQGNYSVEIIGNHTQLTPNDFEVEAGTPLRIVVKDTKGCKISEDFIIPNKQEMIVDLGDDMSIKYGESVYIDSEVYPFTGVELEWTPNEWLDCSDCPDPTASPLENRNYRLTMTDTAGCVVEDDINIAVRKSRDIYIPNAFSPNKDGINDVFHPYGGFEITQIESLMVFDRWGGIVYSNDSGFRIDDDETGWDGTAKGLMLDPGTYIYTMNVEFIDGETILYSGEVNLMR